jgi:hypothetical protein
MEAASIMYYDSKTCMYLLCDGYAKRMLLPVGDYLSIQRIFEATDDIMAILDKNKVSFSKAYTQSVILSKAFRQVITNGGELHLAFHMLDGVQRIHAGGFLQVFQWILGWKHVNLTDCCKTYQQCKELAMLVYTEVDRIMRDTYIHSLSLHSTDNDSNFDATFLSQVCRGYRSFLAKGVHSSDWVRRYISNFLLVMRRFILFGQAQRTGDAPMMELLTSEFLPVFAITKKLNMVRTLTRIMEEQYMQPADVLQQIRINRTRRQRGGKDTNGNEMPNKGLDDHMERLMPHMKKVSHAGTFESWTRVSMELICSMKCKSFADFYLRLRNDTEKELNERKLELQLLSDNSSVEIADVCGRKKTPTKPGKRNKSNMVLVAEV